MLKRLRRWVDQKLNGRYYEKVPERIRQLAEKNGISKPNRYIPSASRVPPRIRGKAGQDEH